MKSPLICSMSSNVATLDSLATPDILPVQISMTILMGCLSCANNAWKVFEQAVEILVALVEFLPTLGIDFM